MRFYCFLLFACHWFIRCYLIHRKQSEKVHIVLWLRRREKDNAASCSSSFFITASTAGSGQHCFACDDRRLRFQFFGWFMPEGMTFFIVSTARLFIFAIEEEVHGIRMNMCMITVCTTHGQGEVIGKLISQIDFNGKWRGGEWNDQITNFNLLFFFNFFLLHREYFCGAIGDAHAHTFKVAVIMTMITSHQSPANTKNTI